MFILNVITKIPCWYIFIAIFFSLYYAIRSIMEQIVMSKDSLFKTYIQKLVIIYIQEFLFKFIITMSSFFALIIANFILSALSSVNDISSGTAFLLIFFISWGIIGVSGYLTLYIASGKFPVSK